MEIWLVVSFRFRADNTKGEPDRVITKVYIVLGWAYAGEPSSGLVKNLGSGFPGTLERTEINVDLSPVR